MTTNRGRRSDLSCQRGISRQTFLRGAVGALATSAVFGTVRAGADPSVGFATGWDSLASSIGGRVLVPASGSSFTTGKQVFNALYNGSTLSGEAVRAIRQCMEREPIRPPQKPKRRDAAAE